MQEVGNGLDLSFEQAERVRVGDHEHGGIVAELGLQVLDIHEPLRVALDRHRFEACERRGRGVGAVSGVGDEDLSAMMLAAVVEVRVGDEERRQFAVRSSGRLERHGRKPRDFGKKLLHLEEQFQHPLDGRVVLKRVKVGEPRKRREPFMPLRVVFHRARPQRVEVGVDRHVSRGEVREVPDKVDFADFRQWRRCVREVFTWNQLSEWCGGNVRRGQPVASPPLARELEDEVGGLGVVHSRCDLAKFSARTGDYALRMSRIAATSPSISAFVRFSVTAIVMQSANCGYHRPRGRPAW